MRSLRGRTALLTGAAGGLGTYIALELARAGSNVVLHDLDGAGLVDLERRVGSLGVRTAIIQGDLSDPAAVETLIERAEETFGPIDVLVNNAGIEVSSSYTGFSREEFERVVAVNLLAPMELTRRALPGMLERGRGHVVFMSSLSGRIGFPFAEPYAVTKAGLIALTQSLRLQYGRKPVGFSAVCPGFASTAGIGARALGDAKPPFMLAPVAPESVARAVVRAVRHNYAEVVVTARPVRPVLAIGAIFPRLGERLLRTAGVATVGRMIAERRGRAP